MGNNSQHYIDAWMVFGEHGEDVAETIVFSEEIALATKDGIESVFELSGLPLPDIVIRKIQVDIRFPV